MSGDTMQPVSNYTGFSDHAYKVGSFLRLIVNSCIAELDLFKLTCNTLIFFRSRDSGIVYVETAVDSCPDRMHLAALYSLP